MSIFPERTRDGAVLAHKNLREMEVFSEMKLLSGLLAKEMSMPGGVVFEEQHVYLIEDVRRLLSDSRSGHIMERAMGAYSMRSSPPFVHLDLIRDAIFSAAGIPIGSESGLIAGVTVSDSFARIEPFWKSTERFSEHITHRTVSAKAMKVFVDGVSEAVSSTLDYVWKNRRHIEPGKEASLPLFKNMAEAFVKERFGVTSAAKEWLASEEAKNLQAFLYKVSEYLESKGIIDNPFLKQRYTLDGMASILS